MMGYFLHPPLCIWPFIATVKNSLPTNQVSGTTVFHPRLIPCPCPNRVPAAAVLQTPPSRAPLTALGGALWGKRLLGVETHLGASHPLEAAQSSYREQENSGQGVPFPAPISRGRARCHPNLSRKKN